MYHLRACIYIYINTVSIVFPVQDGGSALSGEITAQMPYRRAL